MWLSRGGVGKGVRLQAMENVSELASSCMQSTPIVRTSAQQNAHSCTIPDVVVHGYGVTHPTSRGAFSIMEHGRTRAAITSH